MVFTSKEKCGAPLLLRFWGAAMKEKESFWSLCYSRDELISWPMNFFISLLSWPMNFFKVYFHDPLVPQKVIKMNFMPMNCNQTVFHGLKIHLFWKNKINGPWIFPEICTWVYIFPMNLVDEFIVQAVLMSSSQLLIYPRADFHDPWNRLVMNLSSEGILVYSTK